MCPCWFFLVLIFYYASLYVFIGSYVSLRILKGPNGSLCAYMESNGCYGSLCILMGPY